jgi:hypothetical protein
MNRNKKILKRLYQKNQDEAKRLLKNLVLRLEELNKEAESTVRVQNTQVN